MINIFKSIIMDKLHNDSTGHDYYHAVRVYNLGRLIAKREHADLKVVELSCLFHDFYRAEEISNEFCHFGEIALNKLKNMFKKFNIDKRIIDKTIYCIKYHESYKFIDDDINVPYECKCVMDADRLDAIGAIGLARTFMYHGYKRDPLYIPNKNDHNWTPLHDSSNPILHIQNKLMNLKGEMFTEVGYNLALERTNVLNYFIKQFYYEWEQGTNDEQLYS